MARCICRVSTTTMLEKRGGWKTRKQDCSHGSASRTPGKTDELAPMSSPLGRLLSRLRNTEQSVRESIAELVQEAGSGVALGTAGEAAGLDLQERALIANVLRLREITANDVMVPRPDIIPMRADVTLDQAIHQIRREGHSRLPVYRDNLDDLLGMVHIKDVFA